MLSSTSTCAILPVTSPVRIASSHWNSKTCGNAAAAAWNVLPDATLLVICDSTAWSLKLSHCVVAIFRAWSSGVPELTRVASWWKNVSVSSSFAPRCGFFAIRAWATTHSS